MQICLKYGKFDTQCVSLTEPSHLLPRVLPRLDHQPELTFTMKKDISREADCLFQNEMLASTPQSAQAVALALILPSTVSPRQIARACHISPQTLTRYLIRYRIEEKFQPSNSAVHTESVRT